MIYLNIKNYRKKKGISQSELSKLTGIPQTTISGWEKGVGEPSITRALLLAKVLNITVENLLNI